MRDLWPGNGLQQFSRHPKCKKARRRRAIMKAYADPQSKVWPFVHNDVAAPEFGDWRLDPLIIPLLKCLARNEGLELTGSCQGDSVDCPYIRFTAQAEIAWEVMGVMRQWQSSYKTHRYWNDTPLVLLGKENGRFSWMLQFYDTLALIAYNMDGLGVKLEDQFAIPKDGKDRSFYVPDRVEGLSEVLKEKKRKRA